MRLILGFKVSNNDLIPVFNEWDGICINFPIEKNHLTVFGQFCPFWPSTTCFSDGFNQGLTAFTKAVQDVPTLELWRRFYAITTLWHYVPTAGQSLLKTRNI